MMNLWQSLGYRTVSGVFVLFWKCSTDSFIKCDINRLCNHSFQETNLKNSSSFKKEESSSKIVSDLHKEWYRRFVENEIPDPECSTKYIIQYVLGITEPYEYELNQNTRVTEDLEKRIEDLCECRLARMPVQYIIKEWDFRDLRIAMCPPVFIPRPETEQLVDLVLDVAPTKGVILEVGCGSGAISLSLLKALPGVRVIAIDQSKMACELTRNNSHLNGLSKNLEVIQSKLNSDGSLSVPLPLDQVDMLVSNPPYVPSAHIVDLQPEIKLYEDLRALEAGRDGLRVVKSLLLLAKTMLKSGGSLLLEVDPSHPKLIQKWLSDHPDTRVEFVKTVKDYCDRERFIVLKKL